MVVLVIIMMLATSFIVSPGPVPETSQGKAGPRYWIPDPALKDLMWRLSQNVSEDFIRSKLENLTAFETRYVHADNHPEVINWIYDEFKAMGYSPSKWTFDHQGNDRLANVIVDIPGTGSEDYYIIGAHLDTINRNLSWSFPNAPAPGADDDGTGVVALLQIAKLLKGYTFRYGIRIIAFDCEELMTAVGATKYVESLAGSNQTMKGMLNVDMIGFNEHYNKLTVIYNQPSYWLWMDYMDPVNREFLFVDFMTAEEDPDSPNSWGDIEPFWKADYEGIALAESLYPRENSSKYKANPYYHTENDTVEHINWVMMAGGIRLLLSTALWLAQPTVPDLTPRAPALPKGPFFEDDALDINVTVVNSGNMDAFPVQVDLMVDGNVTGSTNVTVPAGQFVNVTFHWLAVAGDHALNVTVDPLDRIGEWIESNNQNSTSFQVLVRPDVIVEKLDVVEDVVNSGEMAKISAKVRNDGPNYIECAFNVIDSLAPGMPAMTDFLTLSPGAEWETVFDWASNVNGTHSLVGQVSKCVPVDRDPTNNAKADSVVVNGFPQAMLKASPKDGAQTYQDVTFSATLSEDDGPLSKFRFDFGDGNESGWVDNPIIEHNYTNDGPYYARLMVRDEHEAESFPYVLQVNIENRAPVAVVTADRVKVDTGQSITFSSSDSHDLDGRIVYYNWSILPEGFTSTKLNPTFTFDKEGNYTARLVIMDDDGAIGSSAMTVNVVNRPPKAVIEGQRGGVEGAVLKFSGKASSDPDGTLHSYLWDFGDGTRSTEMEPSHAYRSAGNFTVTLQVVDNNGGNSSASISVSITKKPIISEHDLMSSEYWVFGACTAAIVVIGLYTIAPRSTERAPRRAMKKARPKKARPKKMRRKKQR